MFRKLNQAERVGKWLYESIGDGDDMPNPQRALVLALRAGDIEAAVSLGDDLVPQEPSGTTPLVSVAGEIVGHILRGD